MKPRLRIGLRAQILLTLTFLLAVMLVVVFVVVRGLNRSAQAELRVEGAIESVAILVAAIPELGADSRAAETCLTRLNSRPDVLAVRLLAADLTILAPFDATPFWRTGDMPALRDIIREGKVAFRFPAGPEADELWVVAPVPPLPAAATPADGAADAAPAHLPVAAVAVQFSGHERGLFRSVSERLLLLFLGLIVGLVLLFTHMALTHLVVTPIRNLIREVDRVSTTELAELGSPPEERRGGEMRVLAQVVERMFARLRENKARIERSMGNLKRVNAQLTEAQEGLVRSEKLASIGKLAAGVAHEIGNPISIILGYLEILRQGDVGEAERTEYLADIQTATDRINHIIRDLLDFSRPVKEEGETAELRAAVESWIKLLRPQKQFRQVDLQVDAPDHAVMAVMSMSRLQQVLVNILLNAAEAMKGRGRITVTIAEDGPRVRVAVKDEGPGIRRRDQLRIFDPFYTTKEPGEGTGLGLAICHNLVSAFDGEITVESAPGKGATFTVSLWSPEHAPQASGGEGGRPSEAAAAQPGDGGKA